MLSLHEIFSGLFEGMPSAHDAAQDKTDVYGLMDFFSPTVDRHFEYTCEVNHE